MTKTKWQKWGQEVKESRNDGVLSNLFLSSQKFVTPNYTHESRQ